MNYFIVDASYLVFYCSNSAFREYVFNEDIPRQKMSPEFDPTTDQEFVEIFKKKFSTMIDSAQKRYFPWYKEEVKLLFAIDCHRKDLWRRELYPAYKMNRDTKDKSKDKFNIGKVFEFAYQSIIPGIEGAIIVDNPVAEADDIIYVMCKKFGQEKDSRVIVLSGDRDMVQLCRENVSVISAFGEERNPKQEFLHIAKLKDKDVTDNISAGDFLLFKILMGDSGDNIPPIKRGFGPKTSARYVLDKSHEELKKLFKDDPMAEEGYRRNKSLIAMGDIPKMVTESINATIDFLI